MGESVYSCSQVRNLVSVKGMSVGLVVRLCPLAYPVCRREILAELRKIEN